MVAPVAIERGFTTKDFTALRAFVQRIAPAIIARTYYDPDEDAHAATRSAMSSRSSETVGALLHGVSTH